MVSAELDPAIISLGRWVVEVEPKDIPGYVLYRPAGGFVEGIPDSLIVKLLPKGSPALLDPPQIEALLLKYTQTAHSFRQETITLRVELNALRSQSASASRDRDDLERAEADWANRYGFGLDSVRQHIAEWANQIQAQRDKASLRQQMLAAYAKGEYSEAVRLAHVGEHDSDKDINDDEQAYLKTLRKRLTDRLEYSDTEAKVQKAELHFDLAVAASKVTEQRLQSACTRYPEDSDLRTIWIEAQMSVAESELDSAEISKETEVHSLIDEAIARYESTLPYFAQHTTDRNPAAIEYALGLAYMTRASRVSGDTSGESINKAFQQLQSASEGYSESGQDDLWAQTQTSIAMEYIDLSGKVSDAHKEEYLWNSVRASQNALEVFDSEDSPFEWAGVQLNLGISYCKLAEEESKDTEQLNEDCIRAYQNALRVFTRKDHPLEWAKLQLDIGYAYLDRGERSAPKDAKVLLQQAIRSFQLSLDVRTRESLPQPWASTQMGLGTAYVNAAELSWGVDKSNLLQLAAIAYGSALDVYTKASFPQDWAAVEMNLASVYEYQSESLSDDERRHALERAARASALALEVYSRSDFPELWTQCEMNLGTIYNELAEISSEDEKRQGLFNDAIKAELLALQVVTKNHSSQTWASIQANIATAYRNKADHSSGSEAITFFEKSLNYGREALTILTKSDNPVRWAGIQYWMAKTYLSLSILTNPKSTRENLLSAQRAIESALEVYLEDDFPDFHEELKSLIRDIDTRLSADHQP